MAPTHVALTISNPCPYLNEDYPTCEAAENYCDENVSAWTHCGGRMGVEGHQVDARHTILLREEDHAYREVESEY